MRIWCLALFLIFSFSRANAQEKKDTLDVNEVLRRLMKKDELPSGTISGLSILPAIGYNPSFGFILGLTLAVGKYRGDPATTSMSTATATGYFTTKGVLNFQLRHNTFTKDNAWNFQGNGQITKMIVLDYGIGNGSGHKTPDGGGDSLFPIKYNHVRLHEKVYKRVGRSLLVGGGINADFHFKINDTRLNVDSGQLTPHYTYSTAKGFDPINYITNGLLFNIQYNTRQNPNRSYRGIYADLVIRYNPKWLGSTQQSTQLMTEFRKYISLSSRNPEHVLAFWHLGNYLLQGTLPYLILPGTASDPYNRSGRAYTIGRFKGPSFFYLESEYRFPITANKFLSGVVFANLQTVSNAQNQHLFRAYEPGAGAGIRILFNRATRSNICIDYAFGKYGARGLFFGLNEVF